jgi:hypothetical protein
MKTLNHQFDTKIAIAIATVITLAQPQAASAQILEAIGGAINAIVGSDQPQPQVIQQSVPVPVPTGPQFDVGTNNANGNSLNLCISNCLPPGSTPAPIGLPQPVPQVVQQPISASVPIQQQTSAPAPIQQQTSSTVVQQSNQSAAVQNIPNRPTVNIPPVSLPINLPR